MTEMNTAGTGATRAGTEAKAHAILSPSSAERWINCPPSARINAQAPRQDTVYTKEGTLAHAVAELKARKYFLTGMGPKKYAAEMKKLRGDEMWQEEMDGYTDEYLGELKKIANSFPSAPWIVLEKQLDLSEVAEGMFGTADCVMIGGKTLHVVDFKYGKGVEVEARENPQMMLYALGALMEYDVIYDIDTVRMTIVQPRIRSGPDTWETTAEELLMWGVGTVQPAAELAAKGEGEYAEGDWCRFCAIRGSCRARAGANTALEDFGFRLPPELTDGEVAKALTMGARLKTWLGDVEEYALRACLDGRDIPGYKAVEGRSNRAWTDQDKAFAAAVKAGVPEEMLYERRSVTLAALEKIMGKKAFTDALSPYVTTPPGKPTLVRSDDRRPAVTGRPSAEEEFSEQ